MYKHNIQNVEEKQEYVRGTEVTEMLKSGEMKKISSMLQTESRTGDFEFRRQQF